MPQLEFPQDFTWGAATSAYQIEGGWNADGKGPSIWDMFSRNKRRIADQSTGQVAANHYHRWREDVDLMTQLNLQAYRFSIAWSRVLPQGVGQVNEKGLDFYDRLVDGLLERGITPFPTLYHFDLPQALHEQGGWPAREMAEIFANYARIVVERLGDRVKHWTTLNEPFVIAFQGYLSGRHAPGQRNPRRALRAVHHLLLAHGYAAEAIRAGAPRPVEVGLVLSLSPVYPHTDSVKDRAAAKLVDGVVNRLFLDTVFRGEYPADVVKRLRWLLPRWRPEDLTAIATPLDFLGINYYTRVVVRHQWYVPVIRAQQVQPEGSEYSDMWEIYPEGLYDLLTRICRDYDHPPIYITENGAPFADGPGPDGRVHDERRRRYLKAHLTQLHRAIEDGVPVDGYFVWSLLDNFEWALGYGKRFGIIHIDYENDNARTIKESGHWYAQVIENNGLQTEAVPGP